jgi:hypothetical protein
MISLYSLYSLYPLWSTLLYLSKIISNFSPLNKHQSCYVQLAGKKNYAGSENHSPYCNKEKKATLVPSTVALRYQQTKKALS